MILSVEVGGRTRRVEVRRGVDGEQVSLDGRPIAVDVVAGRRFWSLLIGPAKAGPGEGGRAARSYEVSFADEPGGVTMVHVNGHAVPAVVTGAGHFGSAARRARPLPEGADGPQRLLAPMPGRIVKVLAAVGDTVKTRQGLVVIEAMKMENELRSPKTGTVTEITVAEGASVDAGAVLVIVE